MPAESPDGTAFLIEMTAADAVAVEGSLRVVAEFGGSFGVSRDERARCAAVANRIRLSLEAATIAAPANQETTEDGKG